MEEQTIPSSVEMPGSATNRRRFRRVFLGEHGLRAGWRVLLFVCLYQGLTLATAPVLRHFLSTTPTGPIPPEVALIREFWEVLLVFVATGCWRESKGAA